MTLAPSTSEEKINETQKIHVFPPLQSGPTQIEMTSNATTPQPLYSIATPDIIVFQGAKKLVPM